MESHLKFKTIPVCLEYFYALIHPFNKHLHCRIWSLTTSVSTLIIHSAHSYYNPCLSTGSFLTPKSNSTPLILKSPMYNSLSLHLSLQLVLLLPPFPPILISTSTIPHIHFDFSYCRNINSIYESMKKTVKIGLMELERWISG